MTLLWVEPMKLKAVAKRFDLTPMWDAYTGQKLKAKCQVTAWDSPRRDGLTTVRRTLSMARGAQLPTRGAVVIGGDAWIVARDPSPDTFGYDVVRMGYVAQQAHIGKVGQTADVLDGTAKEVFLSRVWVKDVKDITTTSEAQGQYYVYFTEGEPVKQGQFLFIDGLWHICRNILTSAAGFMVAECNELEPDCVIDVHLVTQGRYNPITERHEQAAPEVLKGILLGWRDDYVHELASAAKEQVGDVRIRFRAGDSGSLKMTSRMTHDGDEWQVVSMTERNDGSVSVVWRRVK